MGGELYSSFLVGLDHGVGDQAGSLFGDVGHDAVTQKAGIRDQNRRNRFHGHESALFPVVIIHGRGTFRRD